MPDADPEDELYLQIGARIRALRKARGLRLQDVVDRGFVGDIAHLSRLERGNTKANLSTLTRLAECFDVPVQDLLPPRPIDRKRVLERVRRLGDDQLRALEATLDLIAPVDD